jgi:hypothetical protein
LPNVEVWRGGVTSDTAVLEKTSVSFKAGYPHTQDSRPGISVGFYIASKGGGTTRVDLWIGPAKFAQIAKIMVEVNPIIAGAAFATAQKKRGHRRTRPKPEYKPPE